MNNLAADGTDPDIRAPQKIRLTVTILAVLALLAGLAIGLMAVAASLGVWVGLWDFRRGFELLRSANENGKTIAMVCLAVTVVIFGLSKRFQLHNGNLLSSLAAIGTIAAALAWYVPETYRPAEGVVIPPIHDITTDTVNPPQFVDVLALRGPGTNTVVYGTGPNMTPERLAELQTQAYPDIQPVLINASPQEVFNQALSAVQRLGWDIVAVAPEDGRIEATDTTFWFRFKDDVVIIVSEAPGGAVVNARSVSRVGVSDVGKNAERLRGFFAELRGS
jgi:uncharacterized protein (DUF1499 family)